VPNPFLILLAVAACMAVPLHRPVFGRYLYAMGRNDGAVRHGGINVSAVVAGAYVVAGGLGGLSTVLLVLYTSPVSPGSSGNAYEPCAIAAALGGCSPCGGEGGIPGIVLGTVLLQTLQNLVNILGSLFSHNFAAISTVIPPGILAGQGFAVRHEAQAPGRALGAAAAP